MKEKSDQPLSFRDENRETPLRYDGVELKSEQQALPLGILRKAGSGIQGGVVELTRKDPAIGRRLPIAKNNLNGAPFDMLVLAEIISRDPPQGRILEVLGDPERPDLAIQGIIKSFRLSEHFPDEVLAEVKALEPELSAEEIEEELKNGRRDLRHLNTMTIDGLDAKDLDDAIDIEKDEEGYILHVHIADVTHYVRPGTALHREALKRGNSVYLVDRVLPMLPPELSNGLCSLNPGKNRFALSCELHYDHQGRLSGGAIYESLIQSKLRFSYEEASALFEADEEKAAADAESYPEWLPDQLQLMRELSRLLTSQRLRRGALVFDFPESAVELDSEGRTQRIFPRAQNESDGIIESFMIAANEWVAAFCEKNHLPAIYRVHEEPDAEKLSMISGSLRKLGFRMHLPEEPAPRDLQRFISDLEGHPWKEGVSQLILRSLARARYDAEDLGHYGLASRQYLHFTAPIRRYADHLAHRSIKAFLHGRAPGEKEEDLQNIAQHISLMERVADDAERATVRRKICEYYARQLGEELDGHISGISMNSLYVQFPDSAEGSMLFASLQRGYFAVDDSMLFAQNRGSGEIFMLGDPVRVRIDRVDQDNGFIDLSLIQHHSLIKGKKGKEGVKAKKKKASSRKRGALKAHRGGRRNRRS